MARRRPPRGAGEDLLRPTPRPKDVLALDDMIAALVELDANGLCLQWRNHLGGTPPAHLPRWLLMKILAYRLQAAAFGGLDKETLRVLRQPKGRRLTSSDLHPFEARIATTREGTELNAGTLLAREWNGRLERVMIADAAERRQLTVMFSDFAVDRAVGQALHALQKSLARRRELRPLGDTVKQRRSDLRLQILICWLSSGCPIPALAAALVKRLSSRPSGNSGCAAAPWPSRKQTT
jgi:Protein of unknown function (DUF2924)